MKWLRVSPREKCEYDDKQLFGIPFIFTYYCVTLDLIFAAEFTYEAQSMASTRLLEWFPAGIHLM